MYEPKYQPCLSERTLVIPTLRYGITNPEESVRPNDPDTEGMHVHSFAEIFFNVEGDVSFLNESHLYAVRAKEAILSRPNELHACIYETNGQQEHFCLWIEWETDVPPFSFLRSRESSPHFSFDEKSAVELEQLLRRLLELSGSGGDETEATVCLFRVLWIFESARKEGKQPPSPMPPSMQVILEDVEENLADLHHVKDLVERHFVSAATLNRWFRSFLRVSPREYLESKKLSAAAALLAGGATVTEACMQTGFSDCSHFIVLFKKRFGMTPLTYRRRANGG